MPFPDLRADEVEAGEGVAPDHPAAAAAACWASFVFAGPQTPSGLVSTGEVGTERAADGSDGDDFGSSWTRHRVPVGDGRAAQLELDANGAELVPSDVDAELPGLDFLDQADVLARYYPHCCALVQALTGAADVYAFDHNVRSRGLKSDGAQIVGGNAVQGPATVIHNDYTLAGAPRRLEQLATETVSANDTLGGAEVVPPEAMARVERGGRWAMINIWRNILPEGTPVAHTPLALVDGASVELDEASDEIVTFEIRYADRVGENYMLKHKPERQRFFYFPAMMRSEAMAIKVWDNASSAVGGTEDGIAPFSFHSAFDEEAPDGPDRQSIEVRTIAFFATEEDEAASEEGGARL